MYRVELKSRVTKFFRNHPDLREQWDSAICHAVSIDPHQGPTIRHMKGQYHCSRRWRAGDYRLLYDIHEDDRVVHVFDAGNRGDIYG